MGLSIHERFAGTLVGVHAGDSLGAPYEKRSPEVIKLDIGHREGLVPFDHVDPWGQYDGLLPAGRPTDDSELTAALAQSLIERGCSDPEHQYALFKRALGGQSFLWEGRPMGFGGTTRGMLAPDTYAESQAQSVQFADMATNGSLMRAAPLALFYYRWRPADAPFVAYGKQLEQKRAVAKSSWVTHPSPVATECCHIFVAMLEVLLSANSPETAWAIGRSIPLFCPEVQEFVNKRLREPEATNRWPPSGSALHTLHIAVWALLTAKNFEDGVTRAVLKGGDTDTAAAVAGALLGAHFGIDDIPVAWQNILKGRDRMLELAGQLYERTYN